MPPQRSTMLTLLSTNLSRSPRSQKSLIPSPFGVTRSAIVKSISVYIVSTLKLHCEVLPALSVAVYLTSVVPSENTSPGLCVEVNSTVPQPTDAVGSTHVTSVCPDEATKIVRSEGQSFITGEFPSVTITSNEHDDVFPLPSLAV